MRDANGAGLLKAHGGGPALSDAAACLYRTPMLRARADWACAPSPMGKRRASPSSTPGATVSSAGVGMSCSLKRGRPLQFRRERPKRGVPADP